MGKILTSGVCLFYTTAFQHGPIAASQRNNLLACWRGPCQYDNMSARQPEGASVTPRRHISVTMTIMRRNNVSTHFCMTAFYMHSTPTWHHVVSLSAWQQLSASEVTARLLAGQETPHGSLMACQHVSKYDTRPAS